MNLKHSDPLEVLLIAPPKFGDAHVSRMTFRQWGISGLSAKGSMPLRHPRGHLKRRGCWSRATKIKGMEAHGHHRSKRNRRRVKPCYPLA
jgi:hypothetical protein